MYHLFVGLELPADIKARLSTLCLGLPGVLWGEPTQFHITLRFIGSVDGAVFRDVVDALRTATGRPFELSLEGVGFFPLRNQPERVWVGVQKSEALERLRNKIESRLVRSGLDPERRKFTPHVTIGKFGAGPVKSDGSRRMADYLSQFSLFRTQPFPVERFCLYSSVRSHEGPRYSIENTYDLSGPLEDEE
jgi:2'-5' RNA ligase